MNLMIAEAKSFSCSHHCQLHRKFEFWARRERCRAGMNMQKSVLWFQGLVRSSQFEISGFPSQLLLATQVRYNRNVSPLPKPHGV